MKAGATLLIVGAASAGLLLMSQKTEAATTAATTAPTTSSRLPKGLRNKNPGNIRYLPPSRAWNGQIGDDGKGYGVYDSMQNGVRATGRQLRKYAAEGLNTVRAIISKWAPTTENNTLAYVNAVAKELNLSSLQPFDVEKRLPELALAIFHHENGRAAVSGYTDATGAKILSYANISRWVYL